MTTIPEQMEQWTRENDLIYRTRVIEEDLRRAKRKTLQLTLGMSAILLVAVALVLFAIVSCGHARADSLAVPMYPDMSPEYDFNSPLECSYYPSSPCYVKPRGESAVERSQREYEQRQRELQRANNKYKRCLEHPEKCK